MDNYQPTAADELPVEKVPDVPFWSENYAFYGYDLDSRTGFIAYAGRWVKNPALWREQLYIYLPDGSMLCHRAIGPAGGRPGPSGGAMDFCWNEAGGNWRIAFNGAMRHDTLQQLLRDPLPEGRPHPVNFQVSVDGDRPVYMMPSAADNTSYGKYHYEQMCSCSGAFSFGGEEYRFNGVGYRDHSRGPRQLGAFDGHVWLQLFFPVGPNFSAYHMWAMEGGRSTQILDKAISISRQGFAPASLVNALRLESIAGIHDPVEVRVEMNGETRTLRGKPLATFVNSFTTDVDFYFGYVPSLADFAGVEQPVLFDDGEDVKILGYLQRSFRIAK